MRKLEYFRYEFNKNNVIIKNSLVDIVINWPFHHRVIFADGPESGHHGVIYYKNENLDRSSIHKCTLSAFAYGKEWIYECWEDKGTSRKAFLFEDEEVDEAYLNIIRQTNPLVEQGKNRLMWAKVFTTALPLALYFIFARSFTDKDNKICYLWISSRRMIYKVRKLIPD